MEKGGQGSKSCDFENTCYDTAIESKDPCEVGGKGEEEENECDIGKEWKNAKSVYETRGRSIKTTKTIKTSPPELENVYLPTRRQCICTRGFSKMKNPETNALLKQLMEVSVYQGYNLGKYYKNKDIQSGNNTTYDVAPCNAMKYSFYDLRDIILGYDQLETRSNVIETYIKSVFTSSGSADGGGRGGKPGSQKRKKFWNTNKECVWNAMICGYKQGYSGGFIRENADQYGDDYLPIGCTGVPNDTYFPIADISNDGKSYQFLRWFAEWSEDFCKQKKKQKDKLEEACKCYKCNSDGNEVDSGEETSSGCDNRGCEDCEDRKECGTEKKKCTAQCEKYRDFIQQWKTQYEKQKNKYTQEYRNMKYKSHVVASTAESAHKYLKEQLNKICDSKSGGCNCMAEESPESQDSSSESLPPSLVFPPSGYTEKCSDIKEEEGTDGGLDEIAFVGGTTQMPEDGDKKGKKSKPEAGGHPSPPPPSSGGGASQIPCDIVATKLSGQSGTVQIDNCKPKDEKQWNCEDKIDTNHQGACMPPRRQLLCLNNLTQLDETKTKDDFRTALIKCVAIETFFSWLYYKSRHTDPDSQSQLESGKIPENFKRIMFYTFSDYRDICLGNDLGTDEAKGISDKVEKILSGESAETWWNTNGKDIWKGMLCGLSHHIKNGDKDKLTNDNSDYSYSKVTLSGSNGSNGTTLEKFVEIPQFLRWMTEWAEDFCKQQKKQYMDLQTQCKECTVGSDEKCKNNCEMCREECEQYKDFIEGWKTEWEKQKGKYHKLYQQISGGGTPAYQNDQQTADINDCQDSKQDNFDKNGDNKYAFEDYPQEYKEKCECDSSTSSKPGSSEGTPRSKGEDGKEDPPQGPTGQSTGGGEDQGAIGRSAGDKGDEGASGGSATGRGPGRGPGQGPGPGQQPPPPPQQQQSGQEDASDGQASDTDLADGVSGGEGGTKGDFWNTIPGPVFSYPVVAGYLGYHGAKAAITSAAQIATYLLGGNGECGQATRAEDSGSSGTGSTGNQNPGSPREGDEDISSSSSSSSSSGSSSGGESHDGASSLPGPQGPPGKDGPNGPAGGPNHHHNHNYPKY
ncbi:erythrocyte membrane protein 1, PfEMP1,putative [Plasmodium sp.]|nr:erythrocyte membrane protein 1, PfEMP1,putative [Plasmodium sp.]